MTPVDNGSTVACAIDKFSQHGNLKSSSPNYPELVILGGDMLN